jgi:cytochrome c oxidase assembly protein subunit 15
MYFRKKLAIMQMYNKNIATWLFICCFMVVVMVLIGGVTRLTGSGLSMTDWKPLTGWLPPLSAAGWIEEFGRYQASPQYQKINMHMDVQEFKSIFWLEYLHRLAGRITGLVFFLPLAYFIFRRQIDKNFAAKLFSILLLGAAQGVIGWFMVSSGLKDRPHVSQYWLAFHLATAFFIYALLFLLALSEANKGRNNIANPLGTKLASFAGLITLLVFMQVIMGAFVAGLHAGFIYNTFPLMDGKIIPGGLFSLEPWQVNIFEDIKTVQFIHRILAFVVFAAIFTLWIASKKAVIKGKDKLAINLLFAAVCLQFCLGVLTLVNVVPIALASAHQVGALLLFSAALYTTYGLYSKK